jgi:hypothetical protein
MNNEGQKGRRDGSISVLTNSPDYDWFGTRSLEISGFIAISLNSVSGCILALVLYFRRLIRSQPGLDE